MTSLYCAELVPVPTLREASGRLDIVPVVTPFGTAVTPDGAPRVRLATTIAGLPAPERLGRYRVYVAWAATISLDREVRLGIVTEGRSALGEIQMAQFRLFVTAEASPDVKVRTGPVVLRGTSPMARLLAHRDVLTPGAPGTPRGEQPNAAAGEHDAHHHVPAGGTDVEWRMPPMLGLPMMPGMAGLSPSPRPYLPGTGVDPATIAAAAPRAVIGLKSGDTLTLDARMVRRTIGGRTFVMYGFNGQYPGPLIKVAQNSTVTVTFTNNLDMPTAVHWHGLRLDNRSDGVPGVTQDPVEPGGPSPTPCTSRRRHLLVPPARPRRHPAGPRPLRQHPRRSGRPGLLRPGEPRGDLDPRRLPDGRRRAVPLWHATHRPTRSWDDSATSFW